MNYAIGCTLYTRNCFFHFVIFSYSCTLFCVVTTVCTGGFQSHAAVVSLWNIGFRHARITVLRNINMVTVFGCGWHVSAWQILLMM